MYRSYQPILPCGNKYLQQKWDQTNYDEHRRKVQEAKSMVDTNSPHTYIHLNMKLKKLKLEEERLTVIERDNRLLLEKMSTIMRTKGRIDNQNEYEAKSLNKEKREHELLKISRENQAILDRISKCEPQYQVKKWQEDWLKTEKYMDSIAKYPRGWYITEQGKKSKRKTKSTPRVSKKGSSAKAEAATSSREDVEENHGNNREKGNRKEAAEIRAAKAEETQIKKVEKDPNTSQAQSEHKEDETASSNNMEVKKERSEGRAGGETGRKRDTDKETTSESGGSQSDKDNAQESSDTE